MKSIDKISVLWVMHVFHANMNGHFSFHFDFISLLKQTSRATVHYKKIATETSPKIFVTSGVNGPSDLQNYEQILTCSMKSPS